MNINTNNGGDQKKSDAMGADFSSFLPRAKDELPSSPLLLPSLPFRISP